MKVTRLPLLIIIIVLSTTSCRKLPEDLDGFTGVGRVEIENRTLASFENVHLSSVVNAMIFESRSQTVSVIAGANILDLVTTEVRENTLYVNVENGDFEGTAVTIEIGIPSMASLTTDGTNSVDLLGITTNFLEANLQGEGHIFISGETDELIVNSTGSTDFDGFGFLAKTCKVSHSGTGKISVSVGSSLFGTLTSSGDIVYQGSPQIEIDVTGRGRIIDAN